MSDATHPPTETTAVVIIGRNEGDRLVRCLESVQGGFRAIVYVDSGSTDGSVDAARRAGAFVVELDVSVPFTAARARNAGYEAVVMAHPGIEFVQFVDGDCEVDRGWLNKGVSFLARHSEVAVVCGRRRERFPEASIYNRMFDREWETPIGLAEACGGDALMRCQAFNSVEGFNSALICGEEPELCVRLREQGWKIWRLDEEMTLHDAAMTTLSQWWKRNVRSGYGFVEVCMLHRDSPCRIWHTATLRAVLWGGVAPVSIGLGALIHPAALVLFAIYPVQIVRIALRDQNFGSQAWFHAGFVALGKFPEFQGVVTYVLRKIRGAKSTLIEYKTTK